ncbi:MULTISPECIES: ABC transporter ATP-binding protein [unclassified Ensifer]|uniref:ABC transporter ATP-binding protein n=1 Tax=unclassified Ensifer TaxID=2633371 RepID=UPI00070BDE21|nr:MULTISPECIES: ABC transporter ATP-binding protein [unclassified Ensifer]KQW42149.1 ABC transporter [Ensifer sp. Root1252]KQY65130.1 ABC transporter [Ensifer sp. Root142]KRC62272.1 ABC transporter [Ensifer sp. Root231]KRC93576.1 ABC transporter [Ensifer sp. Root258]
MAKLELKGIEKRYGNMAAVRDISLEIASGELVCLLGPSGSGKSTLLRIMGGFEKPTAGSVLIDGIDVTARAPESRPTAMVFQSHALWTHMNVFENIAFGLKLRKMSRTEIARKVDAALDLVGLSGYGKRSPLRLSGGQQQRVAIARCIVLEPKILLMDEPFASLDQHLRERLREEVRNIQRELGITTVFVTHGQDEALAIADRVVVMSVGKINQVGGPADIYAQPQDRFVAGFIGAMNLIDGRVSSGVMDAAGFRVKVPLPDGEATLAVRPEKLAIAAQGGHTSASAKITRVVHFGAYRTVEATTDGVNRVKIHADTETVLEPGQEIFVDPVHFSVFKDGHDVFRSASVSR